MVSGKHTEDYRLENVTDRKGRLKTAPVYCGPYFRFSADAGTVARAKRVYPALSLLSLAAALAPLLLDTDMTRRWYVLLPLVLCLLPVFWLLAGSRRLLTAGERVTREHKDKLHDRFAAWSVTLLAFSALSLIGQAFYYFSAAPPPAGSDLAVTVCTAALICIAAVLFAGKKALLMELLPSTE